MLAAGGKTVVAASDGNPISVVSVSSVTGDILWCLQPRRRDGCYLKEAGSFSSIAIDDDSRNVVVGAFDGIILTIDAILTIDQRNSSFRGFPGTRPCRQRGLCTFWRLHGDCIFSAIAHMVCE